jgi:hypothetical protein
MTERFRRAGIAVLTVFPLLLGIAAARSAPTPNGQTTQNVVRLDEATMIVEVNATDGDAGLQVFLDGEAWQTMAISGPDGREIVDIDTKSRLKNYGLTELFSESSEPTFDEFPLKKFKKLFPEGKYSFDGTTIEGDRLVGKAKLSHDIPDGPNITAPADGAMVAPDDVVASWDPVPQPSGVNIVGYRAIVEREDPLRVFSVDLPASATSVTIPSEFLETGIEYLLEVQAIEASGNQTLTEIRFLVG